MKPTKARQIEKAGDVAFDACRQINPNNLLAAAEAIPQMWKVLNDALPIIEAEAERRAEGMQGRNKGPYWNEMRELTDQIERVIRKATKKE